MKSLGQILFQDQWDAALRTNPLASDENLEQNEQSSASLIGQGFTHATDQHASSLVSELLVPEEPKWAYAYQSKDSLQAVLQHGPLIDEAIHHELRNTDGDFGKFYSVGGHIPAIQDYAHYVWAWQWVKSLWEEHDRDARRLVGLCSRGLVEHALRFKLRAVRGFRTLVQTAE